MPRRLSITCLVLAWFCANGALLDVVQVFAWGRMFAGYVETMPVEQALARTFDPGKPCAICLAVCRARTATRHPRPAAAEDSSVNLVLFCVPSEAFVPPLESSGKAWLAPVAGVTRWDPVPVPPPRAAAARLV